MCFTEPLAFLNQCFHAPALRGSFLLLLLLTLQVYVLFGFVFKKILSAHSKSFCGGYMPIYSPPPPRLLLNGMFVLLRSGVHFVWLLTLSPVWSQLQG